MKRLSLFTLLACAGILHAALPALAQDRYVDGSLGDNGNDGTEGSPWQSIQYAVDSVDPGQTIFVRAGTYAELVAFLGAEDSGSTGGGFVTLTAYPGEAPIIDGTTLVPSGRQGLVTIQDASYVRVSGFAIRNFETAASDDTPIGIYVQGESHHVELTGNQISGIRQNHPDDGGANGIGVYGTSAAQAIHDLVIDGNDVGFCKLMWSESMTLNGNVREFVVSNNVVHDCDNIGIDFIGYEGECADCTGDAGDNVDRARDGRVIGNLVYNIDTIDNPVYEGERSAAGYYVDGGANILIERNLSRNNNIGIELASEHFGKATEDIIVRSNLVHDCQVSGISTGGYSSGNGPGGGEARNSLILNNTLYQNTRSDRPEDDWGAELLLQSRNIDNVYKNNIVYARAGKPRVLESGQLNAGNDWGNQLYFGSTVGETPGSVSTNDPLLVDPANGDLHLSSESPAIDFGETLADSLIGTMDFEGNDRVADAEVDIGGYELGSPPSGLDPIEGNSAESPDWLQTSPNPFHLSTRIRYRLAEGGFVSIGIYDVRGRSVARLVEDDRTAGSHEVDWDGIDGHGAPLASGVYFIRLESETISMIRAVVLLN